MSGLAEILAQRWSLSLDAPFPDAKYAWVAPATREDGTPCVLKIGIPHFEAIDEIRGLQFLDGDGAVRVYEAAPEHNAMLLERCIPGTPLNALPPDAQDEIVAQILRRLWRPAGSPFRPLSEMIQYWIEETERKRAKWADARLVEEGIAVFNDLLTHHGDDAFLATDLHAGNILNAEREPWLIIDPKPFIGDKAFDATQHLLNHRDHLPKQRIENFAQLLGVDRERVRLWLFARLAVGT